MQGQNVLGKINALGPDILGVSASVTWIDVAHVADTWSKLCTAISEDGHQSIQFRIYIPIVSHCNNMGIRDDHKLPESKYEVLTMAYMIYAASWEVISYSEQRFTAEKAHGKSHIPFK